VDEKFFLSFFLKKSVFFVIINLRKRLFFIGAPCKIARDRKCIAVWVHLPIHELPPFWFWGCLSLGCIKANFENVKWVGQTVSFPWSCLFLRSAARDSHGPANRGPATRSVQHAVLVSQEKNYALVTMFEDPRPRRHRSEKRRTIGLPSENPRVKFARSNQKLTMPKLEWMNCFWSKQVNFTRSLRVRNYLRRRATLQMK